MLYDKKGQGLTEYIIGLSAVMVLAVIVVAVFNKIGDVWTRTGDKIDALP
jgi:hypothetical protein